MVTRSSLAVVCLGAGLAHAEVDLADVRDIEALSLADLLERPTITASRYAQRPADSPMVVSSIDAEQLDALGYRSLGEALRSMRGVYLSNDRNYSYLGSRGFAVPGDYNTRFALAIDGHRVNDIVYGQATPGLELGLPLIAIERVELLRGGAWSVYGQNALLGAIQIVTATGASRPGLEVRTTSNATAETYGDPAGRPTVAPRAQDVSASYGYAEDGVDLFVAANYLTDPGLAALYMPALADAEGCVDPAGRPRACDGVVVGGDKEEVGGLYVALRTKRLAVRGLASSRRKLTPTAAFESAIGLPIETVDQRIFGDVAYSYQRPRGDLDARIALDYYDYHGHYPYGSTDLRAGGTSTRYTNEDLGRGLWATGELRGRYLWKRLGRHLSNVELAAGTEAQLQRGEQRNTDQFPTGDEIYLDRVDSARTVAVNAHALARAFDRVVVFGTVRGDYHPDAFGVRVNPGFGLVLDLEEHGRLRASQVYGFRAPNLYELTWVMNGGDDPQPSKLTPERSETREVSFERYLGKHARVLVVGYMQEFQDLITYASLPNGEDRFVNAGRSRGYGAEVELEARWGDRLQLRASYAYQHTEDDDGAERVNSPRSLAVVTALVPFGERGLFAAETNYIGARLRLDGGEIPPAFLTTLSLTLREIAQDVDLTLGVRNVFDVRTGDPGGEEHLQPEIPTDPRTLWLQLRARIGGAR